VAGTKRSVSHRSIQYYILCDKPTDNFFVVLSFCTEHYGSDGFHRSACKLCPDRSQWSSPPIAARHDSDSNSLVDRRTRGWLILQVIFYNNI